MKKHNLTNALQSQIDSLRTRLSKSDETLCSKIAETDNKLESFINTMSKASLPIAEKSFDQLGTLIESRIKEEFAKIDTIIQNNRIEKTTSDEAHEKTSEGKHILYKVMTKAGPVIMDASQVRARNDGQNRNQRYQGNEYIKNGSNVNHSKRRCKFDKNCKSPKCSKGHSVGVCKEGASCNGEDCNLRHLWNTKKNEKDEKNSKFSEKTDKPQQSQIKKQEQLITDKEEEKIQSGTQTYSKVSYAEPQNIIMPHPFHPFHNYQCIYPERPFQQFELCEPKITTNNGRLRIYPPSYSRAESTTSDWSGYPEARGFWQWTSQH